jgi:hypothetical protein
LRLIKTSHFKQFLICFFLLFWGKSQTFLGYRIPEMTQNDPKDLRMFQNVLEKLKMSQKILE